MAYRLGPLLQSFFQVKSGASSHSLSNFCTHCGGSNQKVRNWSKILGYSTSLVVFGFGVKSFNKRTDPLLTKFPVLLSDSCESGGPNFSKDEYHLKFKDFVKKIAKPEVSIANLLRFFPVITPVACACQEDCSKCPPKCDPFSTEGKPPLPATCDYCTTNSCPPVQCECSSSAKDSKNGQCSDPNCRCKKEGKQTCPNRTGSSKCSSSSSSSSSPCGNRKHCSEPAELDLEALKAELANLKQIDWAEESDLSHCRLIRQASQITVDSVTRIITETASAYEDYNFEYRKVLDVMIDTLEDSRNACGSDLEILEVKMVIIRSKIEEWKRKIAEVDRFLSSLEKLAVAAAETAFIAHGEYASIAMSERIQSLDREVKCIREETKEKERDMLQLQSMIIVESGKGLK